MRKNWQLSRIGKQYSFSSAHRLTGVPDNHPCFKLHGHNYVVELEVRGEISERNGFCNGVDFHLLDDGMKDILSTLDHTYLNDVVGLENPTAENIAKWILSNFVPAILYSVTVWETPKCYATVINSDGYFQKEHRE